MFKFFTFIAIGFCTLKGFAMENEMIDHTRENAMVEQVPPGAIFEHYKGKRYKILVQRDIPRPLVFASSINRFTMI